MASTRFVTILTKQSNQPSAALPVSAATGEGFVNTADGKLYYKGYISGTGSTTYLPSLDNAAFFEVGSHVSQLKIDNSIVSYSGQSGSGLIGKFLSGTTNGFVLADIASISGVGIYTTGATFSNNTLILTNNTGGTVSTLINNFSGLTVNGNAVITGNTNISGNTTISNNLVAANILTQSNGFASIGTGGLIVGSGGSAGVAGSGDLVVHGNLTIFGNTLSAFTSELYIEDKNIILNYNPTGDTYNNSLGSGISIQDGLGVSAITGDSVFYQIAETSTPINISDAYLKRFWETNLMNLMLGSTGGTGSGLYVIKENDIIIGGSY